MDLKNVSDKPLGQVETNVMPDQAPQQNLTPPLKKNKAIIAIVGVVVLVSIAVAGYGFWNGSQVKSYAKRAGEIVTTVEGSAKAIEENGIAKNFDIITESSYSSELEKLKSDVNKFSSETEQYYNEISSKKVPGKVSKLGKDLKEYTKLAKEYGEQSKYAIHVMESALELANDMTDLTTITSEEEAYAKMKDGFEKWLNSLKKITPPESMKETHDKLVKMLEDVVDALDSGNYEIFNEIASPFEDLSAEMDSKNARIEELKGSILKESDNLKNTNFVLF